jgi:thioesterase domain-containing protein
MVSSTSEKSSTEPLSQPQLEKPTSDFWLTVRTNVRLQQKSAPIQPVLRDNLLGLSPNQERLWLTEKLQPGSSVHNLLHTIRFTGLLNVTALKQSLSEMARRHEILRTCVSKKDGKAIQIIQPDVTWQLPLIDLRYLPATEQEAEALRLALAEAEHPFDLAQAPLWRFKLLQLSETEHILIRVIHHIIFDGWSHSVTMRELGMLYEAFSTGKDSPLADLPIQYADFAHWHRQWLSGQECASQLDYWKQRLSEEVAALALPTDHPTPIVPSYQGACQSLTLSESLTDSLKRLSHQHGVSLFVTLLAAFKTLLHRYTGQEDMVVCSPVASRHRPETRALIGYFNNVVILRTDLTGNPSFLELLNRTSQGTLGAYENQEVPLQTLAELPHLARKPLTRAMFTLRNTPNQTLNLNGLTISSKYIDRAISNFDLSLAIEEDAGKLIATFQYKTEVFEDATIAQMLANFQSFLELLVDRPEQFLSELPALCPERSQLPSSTNFASTDAFAPESDRTFIAPRDQLERELVAIWEKALGVQSIGVRDNLFAMGVSSLLIVQLTDQIETAFKKKLSLLTLFQSPTIEQLADALRQDEWVAPSSALTAIQPNGSKPPLFLCEGISIYYPLLPYLGQDQPVYGLVPGSELEASEASMSLKERAAHYVQEIRAVQPQGPYFLGGISWGGIAALEMAQQLLAQGQEVGLLVFLDTVKPGAYTPKPIVQRWGYHLRKLAKSGPTYFLDKLNHKWQQFRQQRSKSQQLAQASEASPASAHAQHAAERLTFHQLCQSYVPQPYSGRLAIFRASDRDETDIYFHYQLDSQLGWGDLATGGIDIYPVPGDHLGLLKEPHVQVVGEQLKACLEQAQSPMAALR